jgi:hypothetical protein
MSARNQTVQSVFGSGSRHSIAIYIPSTVDVDTVADTSAWVNGAMELFSNKFGGATKIDAVGGWVSPDVGLVLENVTRVYTFVQRFRKKDLQSVRWWAYEMLRELKQEAVLVEIDGEAFFLSREPELA